MTHLILGATGQDGVIASELLAKRGLEFYAGVRQIPKANHPLLRIVPPSRIVQVDVANYEAVKSTLRIIRPTRILNLAGISHVGDSWSRPSEHMRVNFEGAINVFRSVVREGLQETTRVYQASSAEVFGRAATYPQDEQTPFAPTTPYGASKAAAHECARIFRDYYGLWLTIGTLFNHESHHRPESFVVRHVTASVARIRLGKQQVLEIGDLESERDWGYAPDYVEGMLRMLEFSEPEDFVLATGKLHSVRELVAEAFAAVGISAWGDYVEVDANRIRPAEPLRLVGNASKAKSLLRWTHTRTFRQIVREMVTADLKTEKLQP